MSKTPPPISDAEAQVMRQLWQRAAHAEQMRANPATVRNQLHAIYQKLDVGNRTALAHKLRGAASNLGLTRLERLDCRGNALTRLDVTMTRLEWLDCSDNGLVSLDVNGLRGLAYLDCGGNSLPRLDLQSNASLATLLCPDNALAGSLDVTSCASGLRADVRGNPSLATVYCLASQSVDFNGPTELVRK